MKFELDWGDSHELQSSILCFAGNLMADHYTKMSILEYDK